MSEENQARVVSLCEPHKRKNQLGRCPPEKRPHLDSTLRCTASPAAAAAAEGGTCPESCDNLDDTACAQEQPCLASSPATGTESQSFSVAAGTTAQDGWCATSAAAAGASPDAASPESDPSALTLQAALGQLPPEVANDTAERVMSWAEYTFIRPANSLHQLRVQELLQPQHLNAWLRQLCSRAQPTWNNHAGSRQAVADAGAHFNSIILLLRMEAVQQAVGMLCIGQLTEVWIQAQQVLLQLCQACAGGERPAAAAAVAGGRGASPPAAAAAAHTGATVVHEAAAAGAAASPSPNAGSRQHQQPEPQTAINAVAAAAVSAAATGGIRIPLPAMAQQQCTAVLSLADVCQLLQQQLPAPAGAPAAAVLQQWAQDFYGILPMPQNIFVQPLLRNRLTQLALFMENAASCYSRLLLQAGPAGSAGPAHWLQAAAACSQWERLQWYQRLAVAILHVLMLPEVQQELGQAATQQLQAMLGKSLQLCSAPRPTPDLHCEATSAGAAPHTVQQAGQQAGQEAAAAAAFQQPEQGLGSVQGTGEPGSVMEAASERLPGLQPAATVAMTAEDLPQLGAPGAGVDAADAATSSQPLVLLQQQQQQDLQQQQWWQQQQHLPQRQRGRQQRTSQGMNLIQLQQLLQKRGLSEAAARKRLQPLRQLARELPRQLVGNSLSPPVGALLRQWQKLAQSLEQRVHSREASKYHMSSRAAAESLSNLRWLLDVPEVAGQLHGADLDVVKGQVAAYIAVLKEASTAEDKPRAAGAVCSPVPAVAAAARKKAPQRTPGSSAVIPPARSMQQLPAMTPTIVPNPTDSSAAAPTAPTAPWVEAAGQPPGVSDTGATPAAAHLQPCSGEQASAPMAAVNAEAAEAEAAAEAAAAAAADQARQVAALLDAERYLLLLLRQYLQPDRAFQLRFRAAMQLLLELAKSEPYDQRLYRFWADHEWLMAMAMDPSMQLEDWKQGFEDLVSNALQQPH